MSKSYQEAGHDGTVFKPLSDVERAINATSAGDFLLFMIALNKQQPTVQSEPIIIGHND